MSRSRKRHIRHYFGGTKRNKKERTEANKRLRLITRRLLDKVIDDVEVIPEKPAEVSDVYGWTCDGWRYKTEEGLKDWGYNEDEIEKKYRK